MATEMQPRLLNPFPPHRRGLWRMRAVPYLYKDRWPEAPFGDRWRALKARLRALPATGPNPCLDCCGEGA